MKTEINVNVEAALRPCYVDGEKALFHRWYEKGDVVAPSVMVGGHSGGELKCALGIVEYESGQVASVLPSTIKFADTAAYMKQFAFNETEHDFLNKKFNLPKEGE